MNATKAARKKELQGIIIFNLDQMDSRPKRWNFQMGRGNDRLALKYILTNYN